MGIGFAGFAAGTWMMSHLTGDWDFWELLMPQILRGSSLMLCMVPINNIALGTLPPARIRNASGFFNLTRNLGGAVGLAIINTILTQRQDFHYARLAEHVQWGNPEAVERLKNMTSNFDAYGLDGATAALKQLAAMVQQQATILSFSDIFRLLTVLFLAMIFGVLMISKPGGTGAGGGGH